MTDLKELFIEKVANADLQGSDGKLQQKCRNKLRADLLDGMLEVLSDTLGCDLISVVRTADGIGLAIDNEKLGFIPIEIGLKIKNLDNDMLDLATEYQEHLKEMQEKATEKAKRKAEKIARDKAERERKAAEKLAREQAEADGDGSETELDFE